MKKAPLYLLLVALAVFSSACDPVKGSDNSKTSSNLKASSNSADAATRKTNSIENTVPGKSNKVSFVVDGTGSYPGEQLQQLTIDLKTALMQVESLNFADVSNIGLNGKQSWEPTRSSFDLSAKPVHNFNQAEATEWAKTHGCGLRLNCIEGEVQKLRKQAESDYQSNLAAYRETRRNAIEKINEAILQSPVKSPACSDIQEQAEFAAQLPANKVIWLTDGEHNCKTIFSGVEFKNKSVMLLVLPVNNEAAGGFGKRLANLSAKFPNAEVKPISSVNLEVMAEFLAR